MLLFTLVELYADGTRKTFPDQTGLFLVFAPSIADKITPGGCGTPKRIEST